MTQLVRYIHLNPGRANMVAAAEEYPHSSMNSYLGIEAAGVSVIFSMDEILLTQF